MVRISSPLVGLILPLLVLTSPTVDAAPERQSGKIVGTGKEKLVITLTGPKGGWTVDRMVEVSGQVSDTSVNPVTVNINGSRYMMKVTSQGHFKRKYPVTSGKNTISVIGTNKAGTTQVSRTVFAKVDPVAMMAVLTSDTDGVYTDLHIYEPLPEAKKPVTGTNDDFDHVYWADTSSASGGTFYLNEQGGDFDQPGYGPYLYTHRSPPLGIYRIDANYWPSGDKAHTLSTLNLVLFGGTPNEIRRAIKSPLVMPGETSTLAWIKIDKGQKVQIWSPILDPKPKDNSIWPKWVVDFKARRTDTSDY